MRANSRMRSILPSTLAIDDQEELTEDGEEIVEAGWVVGPSGALLLRRLWGDGWRREINAHEVGGYEYNVNDVDLSLSDLTTNMDTYLTSTPAVDRDLWRGGPGRGAATAR